MAMNMTIEDKKKLVNDTVNDVLNDSLYVMPPHASAGTSARTGRIPRCS